jgi:hypothetical protein
VMQRRVGELRAEGNAVIDPVQTTTYHMWKGAKDAGLSLPDPEDAAAVVRGWLGNRSSCTIREPA